VGSLNFLLWQRMTRDTCIWQKKKNRVNNILLIYFRQFEGWTKYPFKNAFSFIFLQRHVIWNSFWKKKKKSSNVAVFTLSLKEACEKKNVQTLLLHFPYNLRLGRFMYILSRWDFSSLTHWPWWNTRNSTSSHHRVHTLTRHTVYFSRWSFKGNANQVVLAASFIYHVVYEAQAHISEVSCHQHVSQPDCVRY